MWVAEIAQISVHSALHNGVVFLQNVILPPQKSNISFQSRKSFLIFDWKRAWGLVSRVEIFLSLMNKFSRCNSSDGPRWGRAGGFWDFRDDRKCKWVSDLFWFPESTLRIEERICVPTSGRVETSGFRRRWAAVAETEENESRFFDAAKIYGRT